MTEAPAPANAPPCSADNSIRRRVPRHRPVLARLAFLALVGGACAALLATNTLHYIEIAFGGLPGDRRYWDDMAMGIGFYLNGLRPPPAASDTLEVEEFQGTVDLYRRLVRNRVRVEGIGVQEPWRTIRPKAIVREQRPHVLPSFEDAGRSLVLATLWQALGGVAPSLLLWVGALFALPTLLWFAWELLTAGHEVAAAIIPLLLVASPYVVQALALPHSAVGFYLVSLIVLAALATHVFLPPALVPSAFGGRLAAAALLFAICAVCRSGTLAQLPAFLLTVLLGCHRAFPRRRFVATVTAMSAFCLPYLFVRPPQQHNVWVSVWEGLGDFDIAKDYYWSDAKAREAVAAAGGTPFGDPKTVDAAAERLLRQQVLRDVRTDPAWYATIIGKRILATLSQKKLAPWSPTDGYSVERPRYHYRYTWPVDWLGVGPRLFEMPLWLLWSPTFILALGWMLGRRRLVRIDTERLGRILAILGIIALAALPVPVLISTESGIETQAFALTYLLGTGWLVGELLTLGARRVSATMKRGLSTT